MARRRDNGLKALQKRLESIPDDIKKAMEPALKKAADDMADKMRALAPVDEGDLQDSITVTTGGSSTPAYSQPGGSSVVPEGAVVITVGNDDVRYPHLVEYGTADTEAQGFFWPVVRASRKRTKASLKRALKKAVEGGKAGE